MNDMTQASATPPPSIARRHDLDALRAIAMLAGIALHAAMSFIPGIWPVQDSRPAEVFGLFISALHGFRMPLFFLVSGFFTAMLWRKRGLKSLLWHRTRRILLPFILSLVTILPLSFWIIGVISSSPPGPAPPPTQAIPAEPAPDSNYWMKAAEGDIEALSKALEDGADLNAQDPMTGMTPLVMAVTYQQPEAAEWLLDNGADVNATIRDGGTALHLAAFLGRDEAMAMLLERGGDLSIRNQYGHTPSQSMMTDQNTTMMIVRLLQLQTDFETIQQGRERVAPLIGAESPEGEGISAGGFEGLQGLYFFLFEMPLLQHLWFLGFLCWLVVGFAAYALIAGWAGFTGAPSWMVLSPARYVWLIALTMVPQMFMSQPAFGPDTSAGILPMPHVLLYYAIFFGFGALYFDAQDPDGRVGRRYWITIPAAVLICFPIGFAGAMFPASLNAYMPREAIPWVSALAQVAFSWLMTFGCMGLFRAWMNGESKTMRYVSDSSYWLYLAHLPLIFYLQFVVRDWPLPAWVKFILLCVVTTAILLFTYRYLIRYTLIGTMLNGPRKREG